MSALLIKKKYVNKPLSSVPNIYTTCIPSSKFQPSIIKRSTTPAIVGFHLDPISYSLILQSDASTNITCPWRIVEHLRNQKVRTYEHTNNMIRYQIVIEVGCYVKISATILCAYFAVHNYAEIRESKLSTGFFLGKFVNQLRHIKRIENKVHVQTEPEVLEIDITIKFFV